LRHLHLLGEQKTNDRADAECAEQQHMVGRDRAGNRRKQRDAHADDAVEIAAPRRFRIAQPAEGEDEQDGCADVRGRDDAPH
jgi:hypothetical protein